MARGGAYLKMATDKEGFTKAIETFKSAIALAPWVAEGYVDLADAQEKAGLFAEAIQNLNFALLADPNAKNARELRNRVYELEVFAEDAKQQLKASPSVPAPAPPAAPPVVAKPAPPKKAAPAAKKANPKAFVGNWFYKDTAPRGGDPITTHAFSISQNEKGELAAQAPRRTTGATGAITVFEHDDDAIRLQITWKLATIPTYWKTEDYDVTLSADETKLSGSYRIKSSGSREFSEDKVLFKQ
jgi:tetratricopeptide (TPR) repeat protein